MNFECVPAFHSLHFTSNGRRAP